MMNLQLVYDMLVSQGIAARLVGDASVQVMRVHTDTRSLMVGDLFVALKGENFDAHTFLAQAKQQGARAAIAEHGLMAAQLSGIEVPDSKQALGGLAAAWRAQFKLPLIAVTGSNGKTTVTQMIASVLRAIDVKTTWATQGNLNNDIGVPLTLLGLHTTHQRAVVELGMNHPGEIAKLAGMTQANVALVNNAQREHQEFMHTVEAVALENGAAITALPRNGVAVFPADDVYTALWRGLAAGRSVITFALQGMADVTASAHWEGGAWRVCAATPQGSLNFRLAIAGRHNVKNALAAIAATLAAGVPLPTIALGLERFEAVIGRSRALSLRNGGRNMTVVDDTYNANPDSARAAIDVLADLPGPHLLVLGDMGEVGDQGPEFHAEIGEYAAQCGIESLFCLGDQMRYGAAVFPSARHFAGIESLNIAIVANLAQYRSILVKGSRFMKMERAVDAILAASLICTPPEQEVQHAA